MTTKYFLLILVESNRFGVLDCYLRFCDKTFLNGMFLGIVVKVHLRLEGPLFDNGKIFV